MSTNKVGVETWSGTLWFLLALLVCRESLQLGIGQRSEPGPGFIFFWSAIVLAALSLALVLRSVGGRPSTDWRAGHSDSVRVLAALFAAAVYILLFERIGFLLGTTMLMAVMLRLADVRNWTKIAAVAVGGALGMYAVLQVWLQARLPTGVISWP